MSNPYEPSIRSDAPVEPRKQPWIACALATCVAIPLWFIGLFFAVAASNVVDNPAGLAIYMMMSFAVATVIVPVVLYAAAPALARAAFPSNAMAFGVHGMLGVGAFFGLRYWPMTIGAIPGMIWTIIPYYLSVFLFPPMLIGSLVFSLRYNAVNASTQTIDSE